MVNSLQLIVTLRLADVGRLLSQSVNQFILALSPWGHFCVGYEIQVSHLSHASAGLSAVIITVYGLHTLSPHKK